MVTGVSVFPAMASVFVVVVVAVVVALLALVPGAACCGVNHNFTVLPVNFRA